jgi:hypothetical protein
MASPGPPAATEFQGVRRARAGAIVGIIGLIVAIVAPIVIVYLGGYSLTVLGHRVGHAGGTLPTTAFEELLGVIVVGLFITFVGALLYVLSFSALRKTFPGFGGPMGLGIAGLVGILFIGAGLADILYQFYQAVGCSATQSASSCVNYTQLFGVVTIVLLGALLGFLGIIGLLIGLYRIGSRYDSTVTKVGGILYIIPVASIAAPFLVLAGTQGILRRLDARLRATA